MYSLFIDTHDTLITIAFMDESNTFLSTKESDRSHSMYTLPLIKELMNKNHITFNDIKEIIVVYGPGSFTGLRIGLSIAKTIGYSLNIPVKPISSLTAYLVSSDIKENKYTFIEDNKGFYVSAFDKDNNIIEDECYTENIEKYNKYKLIDKKLDIKKILEYSKNIKPVNIHALKANYIKKISVEK